MLITNQTDQDYYFGPLHVQAGVGATLTVDDSSATSLYLNDDGVADAIYSLKVAGKIQVTLVTDGILFPRPTGEPQILHGDGSPEGLIYAGQGSLFLVRTAGGVTNFMYTKSTGVHFNTGWLAINPNFNIPATNPQTGTTYTLALTDANGIVELNNAAAIALTVPLNASVAFPIGSTISLLQTGAGQVTVAGAAGVTVNANPGLKLAAQWAIATLLKRATDTWLLYGNVTP